MKRKPILWVVLLAVMLGAVACGGAPEPTAEQPPQLEVDESEPELAEQPTPTVEEAPPEPTGEVAPAEAAEPEPVEEAAPAESALEPRPHRTAPAPPGTFVSDQAQFVGATDSPQLIEFFTYW